MQTSRSKKYSTNTDVVTPGKYSMYCDLTHYLNIVASKMANNSSSPVVKLSGNLIIQDRFCQNFRQAQWEKLTGPDLHSLLLHSEEMHRLF